MARNKSLLLKMVAMILVIIFAILSFRYFHIGTLLDESLHFWRSASLFWGAAFTYLLAFLMRALAWKIYIPKQVKFTNCVQGVFLSLFINHITPVKAGDLFRAGFLAAKEQELTLDESANSVIFMRVLDIVTLASIAGAGLLILGKDLVFNLSLPLLAAFAILAIIAIMLLNRFFPGFVQKQLIMLKNALSQKRSLYLLPMVIISWVLESFVIWNISKSMGISLSFIEGLWVNSLTVGGQVFQITPGGISTYESVMTAALAILDIGTREAYTASILSHGFKFVFSYFTGLLLLISSPAYFRRELRNIGAGRKKD
ncbi:flippase-like domain-containing protein [Bacillus sp. ISL-35]|uniref:lysylphosphatidylglycerol synthase transmembrane domain-containing protein n=1 Tax=Bacillus sp. ISL-35 TaxID=2819122 RepID=UPI001BEC7DA3|nr:lysylphosphatidylglycerol synthase transmembrane domain-containing protein [Bacillus sp. ISL-35]MBT2681891.1 flippase-like domain-containing protein [Bacillus sp. ISL-35]MBT2702368.1 flippase-like domain-containing protein [Chryseobacterium sp. ISL-80]